MGALRLLLIFAFALNAQYVGSKACYGCHSDIYKAFKKTDMGRSMASVGDWKADGIPTEASIQQPGNTHVFSVTKSEAGWTQTESETGVFSVDHKLDYVVGSGFNGLTFLIRRGDFLFQAPLSYYSRAHKWDLSPGYEQVDLGFSRMVPQECINCHAGRPSPQSNGSAAYAEQPFQEVAIGCENCHGPGENHVKAGGKKGTIVNPAKLKPALADNICLNCHQAGDARVLQPGKSYLDFRPGEWLFDTAVIFKQPATGTEPESDLLEHYSAMQASRCFRESAGKLGCLTCHDPHTQPAGEQAVGYYRAKCLTCHTEKSCNRPASARSTDNCVGCHMPKRDVTQISHSALTNHRIPARSDEPMPALKQVVQDGVVVIDPPEQGARQLPKVMLLQAYQQMAQKHPEYEQSYLSVLDELEKSQPRDAFVEAALGDRAFTQGQTEEAIEHLQQALPLAKPAVYLELGESLIKAGRSQEAIEYLKKGAGLDPYNAVMQKTLILLYINLRSYSEARLSMEKYVETFPEDSFMRSLLARVRK
jgi:hypothetical protein